MPSHHVSPPRPNLENLRKRAKGLLRAVRAGDAAALTRTRAAHPRAERALAGRAFTLADAQLVVAREWSFPSWSDLVAHLALPPESRDLHDLDLLLRGVRGSGSATLLEQLQREVEVLREAQRVGSASAAALLRTNGSDPHEDLSDPDRARAAIAAQHYFKSWSDVVGRGGDPIDPKFEAACDAIVAGDVEALERLLAREPALAQARSPFGHRATLLHHVMANGIEAYRQWQTPRCAPRIARLLLAAGADPNSTCRCYGRGQDTVLSLLVTSGNPAQAGVQVELVEILCHGGAKPDGIADEDSPLWAAIRFGYREAAEALARCGARVDNLLFAAAVGDRERTRAFASEPARGWGRVAVAAHELDSARILELALIAAAVAGHREIVADLLTHGPDLSYREPIWKNNALDAARWHHRQDVVAMLEPLMGRTEATDA
jgi:hypothetical protein